MVCIINQPTGLFSIGDSIYTGSKAIKFPGIPSFSPEVFAYIMNPNTGTCVDLPCSACVVMRQTNGDGRF
jgi:peptide subunit release factor RF-3